ncbi:MAG: anion permease [Halobacteriota archaeon]
MSETLLAVGVLVAVFVGYNIGGATTGVSFGPAVGAKVLPKVVSAALMSVFFLLGGWLIGPAVVRTLGEELVTGSVLTLETGIGVLLFIGVALFVGNVVGVPASTSMTTVGSIAGLGLATNSLNWATVAEIVSWWIVAPVVAFWVSGVIGRYFYPRINRWVAIRRRTDSLWRVDGGLGLAPDVDRREFVGSLVVIGIGCYMAFSSGASNVANAVAPLVGSGSLSMDGGVLLAGGAVAIGAFTIARRTLDTMANDITALPLTAAIVVMAVSGTIVTLLSAIGVPVQLVIVATMSIVGLGWGRATRTTTVSEAVRGEEGPSVSMGALTVDTEGEPLPRMGEERPEDIPRASALFDPTTTARVIAVQNVVPAIATVGSYLTFRYVPLFGL